MTKTKRKRNDQPKINKYGFIHLSKEIYEELGLPRKVDIPIKIDVEPPDRLIVTIEKQVE